MIQLEIPSIAGFNPILPESIPLQMGAHREASSRLFKLVMLPLSNRVFDQGVTPRPLHVTPSEARPAQSDPNTSEPEAL